MPAFAFFKNESDGNNVPGSHENRRKLFLILILRIIIIYTIVAIIPFLFRYVLHSSIPLYVLLALLYGKLILETIRFTNLPGIVKMICGIVSVVFSLLFAFALLVCIIITPQSVYAFFFETVQGADILRNGMLQEEFFTGNLFVFLSLFFSQFFASTSLKQNSLKPLTGLVWLLFGLFLFMYQSMIFALLLGISLIMYLIILLGKRIIYFLVILIPAILVSSMIFAIQSSPGGSSLVDEFLFPQTRALINTHFPQFPLLIDIPGYGINYSTTRLGGKVILTSTPVFEVSARERGVLYLKTDMFDTYTGTSWIQTSTIMEDPQPVSGDDPGVPSPGTGNLEVTILAEVFSYVPYTIDTRGFRYNEHYYEIPSYQPVYGISFERGLRKGSVITLYEDNESAMNGLGPGQFLLLSPELPGSIKSLGLILGENAGSDHEILSRIKDFLAVNYRYNMDTPAVKRDEDFLEAFLFTSYQGYCTHFATAFVILARLNHIPARFVTGYLGYIDDLSTSKVITARSAHAWAEVWLPGKGWHIWEPTHALNIQNYPVYFNSIYDYLNQYIIRGDNVARNSLTIAQLEDMFGITLDSAREKEASTPWYVSFFRGIIPVLIVLGCVMGAGVIIIFMARFIMTHRAAHYWKIEVNRICRKAKLLPPPEEKGWLHWKESLCTYYRIDRSKADTLIAVILASAYRNTLPGESDLKILREFRKEKLVKRITVP